MTSGVQIPLFMERKGRYCNFIKALRDFELYHSITGQSVKQWEKWRTKEIEKYNLSEETIKGILD